MNNLFPYYYLCLPGRVKVVYVSVQVVLSNCMWAINPIVIEKQSPEVFGQYILRFHISMILVNSVHAVCRLHCITFIHWHYVDPFCFHLIMPKDVYVYCKNLHGHMFLCTIIRVYDMICFVNGVKTCTKE